MTRKPFFLIGSIIATIHFIMAYSYIWYLVGKYGKIIDDGSGIILMIYLLILSIIMITQYLSPYYERQKAIRSTILYAAPLFFILFLLLTSNNVEINAGVFGIVFFGIFGFNFLNYLISIFVKE